MPIEASKRAHSRFICYSWLPTSTIRDLTFALMSMAYHMVAIAVLISGQASFSF